MGIQNYRYAEGVVTVWQDQSPETLTIGDSAEKMKEIRIPFKYWSPADREHVPDDMQILRYGTHPGFGVKTTSEGMVTIQFNERESRGKAIGDLLLTAVEMIKKQKEGYHHPLFQLLVPISTRSSNDLIKSLFPCVGFGEDFLAEHSETEKGIVRVAAVIVDLITLLFRLVALLPRALYQRYGITHTPIKDRGDIKVTGEINWGEGVIALHAASSYRQVGDHYVISKPQQGVCIYLG